jgi:hypothetical protein
MVKMKTVKAKALVVMWEKGKDWPVTAALEGAPNSCDTCKYSPKSWPRQ